MKTNCPICKKQANEIGVHGIIHNYYCHDCNVEISVKGGEVISVSSIDENGNLVPCDNLVNLGKKQKKHKKVTKEILINKMSRLRDMDRMQAFKKIANEMGYSAKSIQQYYYQFGVKEFMN